MSTETATTPDLTAALRVALDRLDAYILATEHSDDAIDTNEDREFVQAVREALGPVPVTYPHGYDHRRVCSRTHPVAFPCNNDLLSLR